MYLGTKILFTICSQSKYRWVRMIAAVYNVLTWYLAYWWAHNRIRSGHGVIVKGGDDWKNDGSVFGYRNRAISPQPKYRWFCMIQQLWMVLSHDTWPIEVPIIESGQCMVRMWRVAIEKLMDECTWTQKYCNLSSAKCRWFCMVQSLCMVLSHGTWRIKVPIIEYGQGMVPL